MTKPVQLRCNYLTDPLGVHDPAPRLSWKLADAGRRGARQTAYRILVSSRRHGGPDLWDSGRVKSDATTQLPYRGRALVARERAWWRVQSWDERNRRSESAPAFWEAGLLARGDWSGSWIQAPFAGGLESGTPSPYLRAAFPVRKKIVSARLYVTALGLYEFYLNGRRVGDDIFTPGWTEYARRVQYQVYDVTRLIRPGENAAGAILGDGWYCGHVGWFPRQYYGDRPRLLAQLELRHADGTTRTVATDGSWKVAAGPIRENDLIHGETHDARLEMPGWALPRFDDAAWAPAAVFPFPDIEISPRLGPPVRATQELKPVAPPRKLPAWPSPVWIYDLGQNLVGRVRLRVRGAAGQVVRLRFAEVLNPDGTLYTDNLRAARQTDRLILRGDPAGETWEPRFTFHGFRYVELSGPRTDPLPGAVTAIVLHSDTPRTGTFACSDPLVNRLQRNIDWSLRANFLEVPTDCPQRDERMGWMGDAQIICRTGAGNRDLAAFFNKWQRDIADAQLPDGGMPSIAPHVATVEREGGPAWADAAVICPWTIYLCYGDTALLARHFDSLRRFVASLERKSKKLIRSHPDSPGFAGYGDWLALDGSGKTDGGTPKDLIGTAFFARSADLVARMARVLGRAEDAARHQRLFERVRRAFRRRFLTADGLVSSLTQTGYVLALHFDLAPAALRPRLLAELVRDIEGRGGKLSTGLVGTPYLPHVLSENGRPDLAYRLLHQKQWPSWLYAVTQGATTIWERWDGWTHDKGFQDKGMNSFNHYAYGAIGAWLYAAVAGIDLDPDRPGYKHIRLAPRPGGSLTSARGTLESPHGKIVSAWKIRPGHFEWEVVVPPNTTATATFPVPNTARIQSGFQPKGSKRHGLEARATSRIQRSLGFQPKSPQRHGLEARATPIQVRKHGAITCELPAGRYHFIATWKVAQASRLQT